MEEVRLSMCFLCFVRVVVCLATSVSFDLFACVAATSMYFSVSHRDIPFVIWFKNRPLFQPSVPFNLKKVNKKEWKTKKTKRGWTSSHPSNSIKRHRKLKRKKRKHCGSSKVSFDHPVLLFLILWKCLKTRKTPMLKMHVLLGRQGGSHWCCDHAVKSCRPWE